MQGRLRNEDLAIEIETGCAHCGMQIHLTVDSELRWSVREQDANPLVFVPEVDWTHFTDTYIIDAY